MKRFVCIALVAALGARLPSVFAQGFSEPDEQSVLEKAREKYAKGEESKEIQEAPPSAETQGTPQEPETPELQANPQDAAKRPYFPMVLSFVPGIQNPFGFYDTSLALGAIGSAVGTVKGFQGAGVFSIAEEVDGFQVAGVFNIAGKVEGFQGSGVFNIAERVRGSQAAGVFNMSNEMEGTLQVAGVFNMAEKAKGSLVAGVFNAADTVSGSMIAGVFNVADSVHGAMIGLVNVADHLDGPAIGLVNLIGNGIHELGIQYVPSEDMTYLQYRSGTAGVFALYYAGVGSEDWFKDGDSLIVGVGLGHRFLMDEKGAGLDLEFSAEQELYPERREALAAAADAEDSRAFFDQFCPYPSIRVSLNVPLFSSLRVFLGLETDFDVPSWGAYVPDRLRKSSITGEGWTDEIFGLGFTAWPKLFFGVSI
jgi:hypothetical protein